MKLQYLMVASLVLGWRKRQQTRAAVRLCIEEQLNKIPEEIYSINTYKRKCDQPYQHVYESYPSGGRSVYAA